MENYFKSFSISSYNCNGLKSSIHYVMHLAKSHEVVFLCEHWLQHHDLHTIRSICKDENKLCFLKSSIDPTVPLHGRPYGGVGFVCSKGEGIAYNMINCESDRMSCIQILKNGKVVLSILGVYLPYDNSSKEHTELFIDILDNISCILDKYSHEAPLVIVGDMNTVLPQAHALSDNWYFKRHFSKRSAIFYDFMSQNSLCVANFIFPQSVSYTYKKGKVCTYIDHILIPEYLIEKLDKCEILCSQDNVSDHLPLSLTLGIFDESRPHTVGPRGLMRNCAKLFRMLPGTMSPFKPNTKRQYLIL